MMGQRSIKQNRQLRNFRAEFQLHLLGSIEDFSCYYGLEVFQVKEKFSLAPGYFYDQGKHFLVERAVIERNIHGACGKIGARFVPAGTRLRLDLYAGLGLRVRNTAIAATDLAELAQGGPLGYDPLSPGRRWAPHVSGGFRLEYMLLKSK
ncbi:MAG: hypothetical protein SF053_09915 [Bacteroidia bacterium]|nr:hypothetical protein [Bacteroidia bacterium]